MSKLPVSPIAPTSGSPAAQAGVVQMNLNATTGQIVTGAEFGLATTMGDYNHTYLPYADPTFQAVADHHPFDLLRHNWELNTMMDIIYPSRGSSPNFTNIDTYLNQQGNLTGFFNNNTGTQVVTLGFPSWLNISSPSDQQLYAGMVKQIAQHFIAMGEPVADYELVNEPDGQYTVTNMANTFNVVAQALKSVDPSYRLGGLTETYPRMDDLKTFFQIAGPNIGFVSYHQYVTNGSDGKSDQQIVTDSLTDSVQGPQQVRALMEANGIPDSVPIFLGEYNVDCANFDDPNNGNMVGAAAAAAVTYGLIASDSNATMGALWCAENSSAYSAFGGVGNYQADPIAVVLSDLTQYMPGKIVQTTMPSNTPGLVGYTTEYGQGFSTALIDTNLSVGYTVDLSHDGLPATGLFRVEVSNAHPGGIKTAITDLAHVSVAAGSVVIITDEAPHGGVEFTGGTTTGGGTGTGGTGAGGTGTGGTGTGTGDTGSTMPLLITPGAGSFTDAVGNVYTLDANGNVVENGSPIYGGSGTGAMELANGVVYAQDASSKSWYIWNQSTFTASAAPPTVTGTGGGTGGGTTASSPDFNGDGQSDILWQNDNGTPVIWLMNGTTKASAVALSNSGPTWHTTGTADFNGDGKSDILWQNDNGTPSIWLMNGPTLLSSVALSNPGPTWHITGTVDFNGDGQPDILWRNDDGTPSIWLMNGTTEASGVDLRNPGPTWHITGTADFNGDGQSDILWQNDNGAPVIWLMNGTAKASAVTLPNPGPTWHITGTADFNGDGQSDILWQNDNGAPVIWLMNGTAKASAVTLPNPGPTWHITGTADYNGDGQSDILWQNDNGAPVIWLMNGETKASAVTLPNPGPAWHISDGDRMHFINAASSTGTLVATSQADEFVLTNVSPGLHEISGFDPLHDVIELSKAQLASFADVQAHGVSSASGALFALDSSRSLLLTGVSPGQLHATNFVFS